MDTASLRVNEKLASTFSYVATRWRFSETKKAAYDLQVMSLIDRFPTPSAQARRRSCRRGHRTFSTRRVGAFRMGASLLERGASLADKERPGPFNGLCGFELKTFLGFRTCSPAPTHGPSRGVDSPAKSPRCTLACLHPSSMRCERTAGLAHQG